MKLKDLFGTEFTDWYFDIYNKEGDYLIGTYDRDDTDQLWINFIDLYKDIKIISIQPAYTTGFMDIKLDM